MGLLGMEEEEKNISKREVSGKEKGKMVNLKAEEDGEWRLCSCNGARVSSVFNLHSPEHVEKRERERRRR